jgi:hypothetical protein
MTTDIRTNGASGDKDTHLRNSPPTFMQDKFLELSPSEKLTFTINKTHKSSMRSNSKNKSYHPWTVFIMSKSSTKIHL